MWNMLMKGPAEVSAMIRHLSLVRAHVGIHATDSARQFDTHSVTKIDLNLGECGFH
jgi:hypothetical protein